MTKPEQIKELIKLKTEFLKAYFIILIAISTGLVTLVLKENMTTLEQRLALLSVASVIILMILIMLVTRQIKQLIAKIS